MDEALSKELREIGVSIAALEVAAWAAMRALFETNPASAEFLRTTYPALLSGLSGGAADEVRAKVEAHMKRWLPE